MSNRLSIGLSAGALIVLIGSAALTQDISPDQLDALEGELDAARKEREALDEKSKSVKTELKGLQQTLVEAAARVQKAEEQTNTLARKLAETKKLEAATRKDFESKSENLEASLAALTRIARQPEGALVTGSGELIDRIRSANMLSEIAPRLRADANALGNELERLAEVGKQLAREQKAHDAALDTLKGEKKSLSGLMDQKRVQDRELAMKAEAKTEQIVELAQKANTLGELIKALEEQAAIVRPTPRPAVTGAMARARPTPDPRINRTIEPELAETPAPAPIEIDTSGLKFTTLKGRLRLPVRGPIVAKFGSRPGGSAPLKGIEVAARQDAQVVTPADGQIVYAGPFRSYGGLLIVNVGEGYHLLMAGLDRITAVVGQRIIAGEPVGRLVSQPQSRPNDSGLSGTGQAKLYFEVRRQGAPIDPLPWLLTSERKVSG